MENKIQTIYKTTIQTRTQNMSNKVIYIKKGFYLEYIKTIKHNNTNKNGQSI